MNTQLLYSSLANGIIMILFSLGFYQPDVWLLYVFTYTGIATSIINHGTSNYWAKLADRIMMCILVVVYIYYVIRIQQLRKKLTLGVLIFCIVVFFVSKMAYVCDPPELEDSYPLLHDDIFCYNPYTTYMSYYLRTLSTNIHTITHVLATLTFLFIVSNV